MDCEIVNNTIKIELEVDLFEIADDMAMEFKHRVKRKTDSHSPEILAGKIDGTITKLMRVNSPGTFSDAQMLVNIVARIYDQMQFQLTHLTDYLGSPEIGMLQEAVQIIHTYFDRNRDDIKAEFYRYWDKELQEGKEKS